MWSTKTDPLETASTGLGTARSAARGKEPLSEGAVHPLPARCVETGCFHRLTAIPPGLCSPLRSPSSSEHRAATTLPALQGCFLGLCHASSGQNGGDSSPLAAGGEGGDGWQQFNSTQKCSNSFGKGAQQHFKREIILILLSKGNNFNFFKKM